MPYDSPYTDISQSATQNSGSLGTVGSIAMDWIKWSTWRNPFFVRRVGAAGWDPARTKVGGFLNRFLAPDAHQVYDTVSKSKRAFTAEARASRKYKPSPHGAVADPAKHARYRAYGHYKDRTKSLARMYGVKESQLANAIKTRRATRKGPINWLIRMTGERTLTPMEKVAGKAVANKVSTLGGVTGMLFGANATTGTRFGATTRILGRTLLAAQAPLLAWDMGKIAWSGFESIAEMGAAAAARPRHMRGTGIPRSDAAATMRRQALMEMHGSELGPRRLIGNEAKFLHV